MQVINETNFNTYGTATNWSALVPQSILDRVNNGWKGEDWFDLYRNKNAFQHSHAVTLAGGNERSKFSISVNYSDQEGILGGKNASDYSRYGGRINSDISSLTAMTTASSHLVRMSPTGISQAMISLKETVIPISCSLYISTLPSFPHSVKTAPPPTSRRTAMDGVQ